MRIATFCLLVATVTAQPKLEAGVPADVDMSAAVLDAGASLLRDAVEHDGLRGAVILVARRGRVVLHEAYGWRDEAKKIPMCRDSLFRMASNTKPVVATAILQLVEAGKLDLDDEVRKHLPSFDNPKARTITVRNLLAHTSGFRIRPIFIRPLLEKSDETPDAPSLRAEVRRFGRIGAKVEPGTSYAYSNAGYNTLGALVEVASGMPLKRYLSEKIYQPLGMKDSCNHESDADHDRMSAVFRGGGEGWRISWRPGGRPDYPFVRASGGMISTAWDYAIFCQAYLNGGIHAGQRLLESKTVRLATEPHTRSTFPAEVRDDPDRSFYGLGWKVRRGVFSHGGSDGTHAWVDPHRELIGIVFTQSPGGKNPREQFARVVHAACRK